MMFQKLWNDEVGLILSAELALILTIAVLGVIVGLSQMVVSVNHELNDAANAWGALNHSYGFTGFKGGLAANGIPKSYTFGTVFVDTIDVCDNTTDILNPLPPIISDGG
jgi:hypothetical protein